MKLIQKVDANGINMVYVAEENIAKDEYFEMGNELYVATSAISAGAAAVPGTNCDPTTVAEGLNTVAS